jgi:beta-xylosidase
MVVKYQNPLWPGYCADPFVLKWQNEYYAYGTGSSRGDVLEGDGRMFPVLHSTDLAHWNYVGGALAPLRPQTPAARWAPEVVVRDDTFYMYYSAASGTGDEQHRLRVAVAEHPAGPFVDTDRILLPDEQFTIDAHPFRDPKDGQWYLFFAKDFFDERVGTGIAVVPLANDMITPAGAPSTVLRASADWQVYERNRHLYGRTWDAWHTVEGPCVMVHDGRYYCLYSGGAWYTDAYGVGYGVADHVLGPYTDEWASTGPSVLRGIPGTVLGPGHTSIARGPDDQTEFLIYHAWDTAQSARRFCMDRLLWTPDGPRCVGPTTEPQAV